jgi:CspA family cold shock protein
MHSWGVDGVQEEGLGAGMYSIECWREVECQANCEFELDPVSTLNDGIGVSMSSKMLGTVKWFKDSSGHGLIRTDSGGGVFVHHSDILMEGHRTLDAGQRVEFPFVEGPKGPRASGVVPLYTAEEARWSRL